MPHFKLQCCYKIINTQKRASELIEYPKFIWSLFQRLVDFQNKLNSIFDEIEKILPKF